MGAVLNTVYNNYLAAYSPSLPITMTSYSPCFRKEVGSHGIEERGVYRVHQFEKQEMVVLCKPEDSMGLLWDITTMVS